MKCGVCMRQTGTLFKPLKYLALNNYKCICGIDYSHLKKKGKKDVQGIQI